MASYLPPTEELPIFDNQVFDIANNSYLTYAEAKKYFVSFPIAQGTATISDLIAGAISYLSPASGSFFDIGTNQVSGGTIRIGPTGGTSGVSVHAGNIDCKNNTINNATAGTTGDISLCDAQTRGILNIGTGNRRKTTSTNEGNINIGTGINTNALGAIPQINIGSNTGLTNVTNINIGGTATTTTLSGASTTITSGGLTFRTANGIIAETTSGAYTIFNNLISGGTLAIGGAGATTISGTLTSTGLITGDNALTISSGNITATLGNIIAPTIRNGANTGSISSTGVLTGTSLVLGSGAIGCGAITASGLITADGGIQLPSGDSLNVLGSISGSGAISTSGNISTSGTGTITANGGLLLGSGKGITCGGAVYSPALTNTQIGWSTVIQNSAQVNLTSTSQTILTSSNTLRIGVYLFAVNMNIQTWSPANLTNYLTMTWTNTTGCSVNIIPLACAGTNTLTSCTFSGVLTVTSVTNTITLGGATNVGGYTCVIPFVSSVGYAQMSICRIA